MLPQKQPARRTRYASVDLQSEINCVAIPCKSRFEPALCFYVSNTAFAQRLSLSQNGALPFHGDWFLFRRAAEFSNYILHAVNLNNLDINFNCPDDMDRRNGRYHLFLTIVDGEGFAFEPQPFSNQFVKLCKSRRKWPTNVYNGL